MQIGLHYLIYKAMMTMEDSPDCIHCNEQSFMVRSNRVGVYMTLLEQIEKELRNLPPEKQAEVLDFITFLQQRAMISQSTRHHSLKKHAAFGLWKHRNIDAVKYQQNLRAEWGN